MLRSACVLLLVLAFSSVGCGRAGPGGDEDDVPVLTLPVGAEVLVSVGECLVGAPPLRVCPDQDVATLVSVSMSGDRFELGEQRVEAGAALIRMRAKEEGRGKLTVEYLDPRGAPHTVEAWFQAMTVTEARVSVHCDAFDSRAVHPVPAGSRFGFDLQANSGDTSLTVGDVSLVDAPGFALTQQVDGRGEALAPSEPGTYSWTLVGGGSVEFLVYAPETLELTLTEEPARGRQPRAIVVGTTAGGHSVCIHDRGAKATVTVAGKECAPVLSGVEIDGPLPFSLTGRDFQFELVGRETCDVYARLGDGRGLTRSFFVGGLDAGTPPVLGSVILDGGTELAEEIPLGSNCPGSVSDGRCEYPWFLDGDCYIDSDWRIEHRDPAPDGGVLGEDQLVGVGLTTKLLLSLELGLSPVPISLGAPQQLTFEQDPAWDWSVFPPGPSAGLAVEGGRCVGSRMVMTVKPLAEGSHGLSFHADNLDDEGELDIDARKVDRIAYTLRAEAGSPTQRGPSVELFIRSKATMAASYTRTSGTVLHGVAPLRIATDTPEALSRVSAPDVLASGTVPHTLTVSSPLGADTLTIQVRDASAITGIRGLEAQTLPGGTAKCAEALTPLGVGGVVILGKPPTRPRVTLSGDSLVFSRRAFSDGLCLEGVAPGGSTVHLTWGSATVERAWTVVPASP
ncbi:hypothetical protein [Pyxidicoccus trucidator]|uniref:hypothetical protein n=1 Tax=Pyxidicoccus trucidator TaxID=2709662 RepID=UPI0013D9499E|nr:hypothetical protein [Pyxidicoccus trucidator]